MFKKTLISLAVASSLGLTGCFDSGGKGGNANPDYQITDTTIDRSIVRPVFDPNPLSPTFSVPTHFDLLLLLGATQSARHDFTAPSSGPEPVASALDSLSGFSTSSAFNVRFDGELDPSTVAADQTVFLIALNTDSPLKGTDAPLALPAVNPADVSGPAASDHQPTFRAEAVDVDGGTKNAIRITPLEPLEEGRKYLVLVSNSVKGANGKNIEQSVQGRNVGEGALANDALSNVKAIVGGLNDLGRNILQSSGQDVALAYSFTTNADTEVLRTMMAPTVSTTKLGQQIGFTAQLKAVRDVYTDLTFSELTDKLSELGDKADQIKAGQLDITTLPAKEQQVIAKLGAVAELTTQSKLLAAIQPEIQNGTIHLPQPRPNVFLNTQSASSLATIQGLALQAGQSGEPNAIVEAAKKVTVSEGAVQLPYFQHLPGEDGADLTTEGWEGNTTLETNLNNSLSAEGKIFEFLRDGTEEDGTTAGPLNVNGNFPFPMQQATTTVPVVVFWPSLDDPTTTDTNERPAACDDGVAPNGITIFQHGITVDRSTAMLPAIMLADKSCQAVVAVDQPLHGLAGDSDDIPGTNPGQVPGLTPLDKSAVDAEAQATLQDYATAIQTNTSQSPEVACSEDFLDAADDPSLSFSCLQLDNMSKLLASDYTGERHFGYTRDESADEFEATEAADITAVESGSLFINPTNMLNSRDNLRQSVVDLLNLAATVRLMPIFDANGNGLKDPLLQNAPAINFIGHSLGGISGTAFASMVNNPVLNGNLNALYDQAGISVDYPTLNSVVLHNTGGQVTRLLENSPERSGELLEGLAAKGIAQKTSNYENFFYVFQSVVDSTDPVNFAVELSSSAEDINLLVSEVVGDRTVPNEANVNPLGEAYSAPLAGTEPLMALLDIGRGGAPLSDGTGLYLIDSDNTGSKALPTASFFDGTDPCSQANHGTFVGPKAPNENCEGEEADTSTAFTAMVVQTSGAITGAGVAGGDDATPVPNGGGMTYGQLIDSTLGVSATLENALDQDEAE